MNLLQTFREAFLSLNANKGRSALTMLGIVIGVGAVIAMMAIGAGAQASITSSLEGIGTNNLFVMAGGDADNPQPLTLADADAISDRTLAPAVSRVAPVMNAQVEAAIPGEKVNTSLVGVTPDYFRVQTVEIAEGQPISQVQLDNYDSVVLLGSQVASDLFDKTEGLVGETVRLNGQVFSVIGLLKEEGGNPLSGSDNRVIVPLSTTQLRLTRRSLSNEVDLIYIQAASSEQVLKAEEEVKQILRARHYKNIGIDDFDIMSTQSLMDVMNQITGTMTAFLGGIAGVSLLVGGIGIMNIMLVTVSERTREIGLRKAVGARKRDIRVQFLVESAMLSLGGGFIGILLGWGISRLVGVIAANAQADLNPVIELNSVLLAVAFSAAVGLFFGIYPANRAAGLEPVEALRSE